jgi:hypothetical protein
MVAPHATTPNPRAGVSDPVLRAGVRAAIELQAEMDNVIPKACFERLDETLKTRTSWSIS